LDSRQLKIAVLEFNLANVTAEANRTEGLAVQANGYPAGVPGSQRRGLR
jgi:hypothetical protein